MPGPESPEEKIPVPAEVVVEQAVTTAKQQGQVKDSIRLVLLAVFFIFVLSIISVIRSFQFSGTVNELENTVDDLKTETEELQEETDELHRETNEAREASIQARDALQKAIASASESNSSEAVQAALASIARIEVFLCGGPCEVDIP